MTEYRWRCTPLVSQLEERVGRRWVMRGEVRASLRRERGWWISGRTRWYCLDRGIGERELLSDLGIAGDVPRVERRGNNP